MAEIRAAHAKMFAPLSSKAFPRALSNLEAAGEALKIGGRHRRTQWRHRDIDVPFVDPEDLSPQIIDAVERLAQSLGRVLRTSEVAGELRRQGHHKLTTDQVRHRLESMAHSSERKAVRTVSEWAEPRVQRISGVTSGGSNYVFWAPLGASLPLPHIPKGRTDAVRYAVSRVMDALGRPVSRREIVLWARAILSDSASDERDVAAAEVVNGPRFRINLANALVVDEAREIANGRLRSVRTVLSSRGAYPVRFSTRDLSAQEVGACVVEDLVELLRPYSELESIASLREAAEVIGSQAMLEIAGAREEALAAAVMRIAPEVVGESSWLVASCAIAADAREMLTGWAMQGYRRRQGEVADAAEIHGLQEVVQQFTGKGASANQSIAIDQTTGVAMSEFEDFALEALAISDRDVRYCSPVIAGARRVRGPLTGGNSFEEPTDPLSFLDRVDALLSVIGACHLPALGALAASAHSVLGDVLRDPELLLGFLGRLGPGESMLRQSLVVTLGLLGMCPPLEDAWPDPNCPDQAAAYYACVALGVEEEGERVRLALVADTRARGAAIEISEMALIELEDGGRLGVIG